MTVIPVEFYEFEMANPGRVPRYTVRMVQEAEYELPRKLVINHINVLDVFVSVLIAELKEEFFAAIATDVRLQPIGVVACPLDIYDKSTSLTKLLIERIILLNAHSFFAAVYKGNASATLRDPNDIKLYKTLDEAARWFDIKMNDYVVFYDTIMYSLVDNIIEHR